jgi:hypothetical protein
MTFHGSGKPMVQGQLLRQSTHRAVAIYVRDGVIGVADFIDGYGTLIDAATWLRFNCGTPGNLHALRRTMLESAFALSVDLAERIEALHRIDR